MNSGVLLTNARKPHGSAMDLLDARAYELNNNRNGDQARFVLHRYNLDNL